ncbi:unnamed protein product [Trifolium pratense]|uniref:Uncharacterized protein n=1 Tax=Trifolium pratense TaxID=57577 RepID=A0ACB0JLT4_TRIPR|nr:unnamed protein product [Trifolium pratense]
MKRPFKPMKDLNMDKIVGDNMQGSRLPLETYKHQRENIKLDATCISWKRMRGNYVKTIDVVGVWQENNVVETEKTIEALKTVA